MDDSVSVKSNESVATSDEFDFIGGPPSSGVMSHHHTPTLDLNNGDLNSLRDALSEVIQEDGSNCLLDVVKQQQTTDNAADNNKKEGRTVGQSTFYVGGEEKHDVMKPDISSASDEEAEESISDVDQDCTIFAGVTYLGAAAINAPKSEAEIQRNMAILNEQSTDQGIKVSISVPSTSQGIVVLYDAATNSVISRYEIHRILFYARGAIDTPETSCFAFTWSHGDSQESAIFQCHVFRCDIAEAVTIVSACFAKAFQRVPRSMSSSVTSATADLMTASTSTNAPFFNQSNPLTCNNSEARTLLYVFEVCLEIKEDDGKGNFTAVGKDKNGFKLKVNVDKQLAISIRQVSDNGPQLVIERCFGVLIAAGRHVRHSDMQLLEMDEKPSQMSTANSTGPISGGATGSTTSTGAYCTVIHAAWDPTEPSFEPLNQETAQSKDVKQYMTVAVDLVIGGIQEPVRFLIETPVRVFGQTERNFWYFQRRSLVQQFYLNLKEVVNSDLNEVVYEVLSMETSGELDRNLLNLNLNLSSLIQSPSITSIDTTSLTPKDECVSDGDEPLLSGTGSVSKDCSEDVLDSWAEVLTRWKSTKQRPKQLTSLVRLGIPEALRGEVWQRLAGGGLDECATMMDNYRLLITRESSCENVIQRDIARTFPAHDFFKEAGGLGQDSLYRVSKAYAVYDSEVGYCQGLSFLAATLLLHMPEEQAFCVLVKLMYDYGLRDLYKDGFDNLYLRLYQLNRLMEEQLNALWLHFHQHHIETHMFASQWFLTLFTAKFPLYFVFHIIDVFLLQGIDTIFQVALALLTMCKKDLLQLDFEGILKYFRVSLPKKCRTEEAAKQLIKLACSIKVKKLKKYELDFIALKEAADKVAVQDDAATNLEAMRSRYEEERKLMLDEIGQLKDMLKREVEQQEREKTATEGVLKDYQVIRQRLEAQLTAVTRELDSLKSNISSCASCSALLKPTAREQEEETDDITALPNVAERIRELELELAQAKLARVEAECRNQNLTHQLRAIEAELTTARNSFPPWLAKTISSIKDAAATAANKKDATQQSQSSFISHINSITRRESVPLPGRTVAPPHTILQQQIRDPVAPSVLKDSQSCSNLKNA